MSRYGKFGDALQLLGKQRPCFSSPYLSLSCSCWAVADARVMNTTLRTNLNLEGRDSVE